MLGVQLVTDCQLKTPSKAKILHIMDKMRGGSVRLCVHVSLYIIDFG